MNSKQQVTLSGLFYWFFLLSVYLTVISAQSSIRQALESREIVLSAWLVYAACWVVLLIHYLYSHQLLPVLIHAATPLLSLLICFIVGMRTKEVLTPAIVGAVWLGAIAAFPVSAVKSVNFDFGKESNPLGYVCLNVFVSMVILVPLCVLVYWLFTRRAVPALVFTVLLSLWCGLYQSMSTSERLKKSKFLGMSTRVLITSGLVAAVIGPIADWGVSRWYGLYFVPMRYSPIVGVPVALACGVVARWYRMRVLHHHEAPGTEVGTAPATSSDS